MRNRHSFLGNDISFRRCKFPLPHNVKTTMSVGRLYPLAITEVVAGDTFKTEMTGVCRITSSFLKPIVDNLYLEVNHFFVPYRLLYEDYEKVFGNPNPSAYVDNDLEELPYFENSVTISSGSVGDYLGLPVGENVAGVSKLPFRAYGLIYDKWYRNQNVIDETYIIKNFTTLSSDLTPVDVELPNSNEASPSNYTGMPFFVGKKKDIFTSCLPSTQKGSAISLLPNVVPSSFLPVMTGASSAYVSADKSVENPLIWTTVGSTGAGGVSASANTPRFIAIGSTAGAGGLGNASTVSGALIDKSVSPSKTFDYSNAASGSSNSSYGFLYGPDNDKVELNNIVPQNLYADPRNVFNSLYETLNVPTQRTLWQLQKMLELDARAGSRINEYYYAHFGVKDRDSVLQIPEWLGGGRIPISVQQVAQTSAGSETSPLANVGAFSLSVGKSRFNKGFKEHGFVITCGCIRQLHSYQQGIPRLFMRHKREDIYDPLLAHISEQPIYTSELYGLTYNSGGRVLSDVKSEIFGYNEAWAHYRNLPDNITGQMRSGLANSLDIWHLADKYTTPPVLNEQFNNETSAYIDRTISVETATQDNFLVDLHFETVAIRVMPLFSTPNLVDHF